MFATSSKPDPDGLQIMWFKRDLRVQDNGALAGAAARGPVLPLCMIEPEYWRQPDASGRQWAFVAESLRELSDALANLGQPLVLRIGEAVPLLQELHADHGISALHSHEETGNGWTFARDRRVAAWCRAQGIPWQQYRQHGVERGPGTRNGWAARWDKMMAQPGAQTPALRPLGPVFSQAVPEARAIGVAADPCPRRQRGGRSAGLALQQSFLASRAAQYQRAMSSPLSGANACSRLSPHIAYGTLSMREITQATWARQTASPGGQWRRSLTSFSGRLHWHCHFIQKLEDRPSLEHENMHRAYDGLRPRRPDQARLEAWARGETGLPFVDACMRALRATGWLNFRMRAMLMALASYHLWLDWRAPGLYLARRFTDYEPGIHWPQVQMQSGTTGINTARIYNPVKQGMDQDPQGIFTRRWLPELREIPDRFLQEPWKAPNAGQVLGRAYPFPIIDHLQAAREARQKIWAVRQTPGFRTEAAGIVAKHASRKTSRKLRARKDPAQLSLPFEHPSQSRNA